MHVITVGRWASPFAAIWLAVATAGCAYHLALEGPATDAELCEMAFSLPFVPSAGVGWDRAYAATRDCTGAPGELPVRSGWCGGRQCAAWVGDTATRCLPPGVETREEPTHRVSWSSVKGAPADPERASHWHCVRFDLPV